MSDFDTELERYLHARRKKSSLRDFFSKLWSPQIKDQKETVEEKTEDKPEHIHELKEVAKIALGVIRQLPDEELKNFKSSAEFARLKEILRKYELIH